jgi:hypothetical protein
MQMKMGFSRSNFRIADDTGATQDFADLKIADESGAVYWASAIAPLP